MDPNPRHDGDGGLGGPIVRTAPVGAPTDEAPSGSGGSLQREISLPMLVLYGLGTTVGAGIYALTGEVAGQAGLLAPLAFLVAAVLAGITGLGFAELAGRLPRAAGEAVFVDHAFGRRALSRAVGIAVVFAGIVSSAAITNAFGGYAGELTGQPPTVLVAVLVVGLGFVAVSGAKESVAAAAAVTVVELGGLLLVLWAGRGVLPDVVGRGGELLAPGADAAAWSGVLGGAFLAFFAFLGFEDIDAVAEETNDPRLTLPRAIVATLVITTVLYMAVAAVAVLTVDAAQLVASDAPLALVYERSGGSAALLASIAGLAMINGVLIHVVMVPRVVYGLANLGLAPAWIGAVSPTRHVPVRATVVAVVMILALALGLDLGPLARLTSTATLAVFITTNLALIAIKRRDGGTDSFEVPMWLPPIGVLAATGLFAAEVARTAGWWG